MQLWATYFVFLSLISPIFEFHPFKAPLASKPCAFIAFPVSQPREPWPWLRPNRDKLVPLLLSMRCFLSCQKRCPRVWNSNKSFRQYILHSSLPHCLSAKYSEVELIFQLPLICLLSWDDPSGSTRYLLDNTVWSFSILLQSRLTSFYAGINWGTKAVCPGQRVCVVGTLQVHRSNPELLSLSSDFCFILFDHILPIPSSFWSWGWGDTWIKYRYTLQLPLFWQEVH